MNKTKEFLSLNLQKAVNGYVAALCKQWCLTISDGFWVDELGGIWDSGNGEVTIGLLDMVFCVENNISFDEFRDLVDYNVRCLHFNLDTLDIKSWHTGAPRIPLETLDRLEGLESDMLNAIDEEKRKN